MFKEALRAFKRSKWSRSMDISLKGLNLRGMGIGKYVENAQISECSLMILSIHLQTDQFLNESIQIIYFIYNSIILFLSAKRMKGGLIEDLVTIVNDLKQQNKSINQTLRYLKKTKSLSTLTIHTNHIQNTSQSKATGLHTCKQQQKNLLLKQKTKSMRRCTSCKIISVSKENKQNLQVKKTKDQGQPSQKKKKKSKQTQNKVQINKTKNLISARMSSPVKQMTSFYLKMLNHRRNNGKI